eukprot:40308-Prymnesium_polylepis.1
MAGAQLLQFYWPGLHVVRRTARCALHATAVPRPCQAHASCAAQSLPLPCCGLLLHGRRTPTLQSRGSSGRSAWTPS